MILFLKIEHSQIEDAAVFKDNKTGEIFKLKETSLKMIKSHFRFNNLIYRILKRKSEVEKALEALAEANKTLT